MENVETICQQQSHATMKHLIVTEHWDEKLQETTFEQSIEKGWKHPTQLIITIIIIITFIYKALFLAKPKALYKRYTCINNI